MVTVGALSSTGSPTATVRLVDPIPHHAPDPGDPPRSLPIRAEQPPDDATVIIRAGVMQRPTIKKAADRTFDAFGVYGISVEGVIDTGVIEACRRSERLASYRQVRLSTFGQVRTAGFALLATFTRPHYTLVLPDLAELTVARLDRAFGDPQPNPGRARQVDYPRGGGSDG